MRDDNFRSTLKIENESYFNKVNSKSKSGKQMRIIVLDFRKYL